MGTRGRRKVDLILTEEERSTLQRWARRPKSPHSLAQRCRIVLGCAEGLDHTEVAAREGVHPATVSRAAVDAARR